MENLPNHYWAKEYNTAIFLSKQSPTPSRRNNSPYQLWNNCSPRLARDWKLALPGQEGILIGLENENNSYIILPLAKLKVVITRNAILNEKIFPHVLGARSKIPWTVTEISDHQSNQPTKNLVPSAVEPNSFFSTINCFKSAETIEQNPTYTDDLLEETVFEEVDTSHTQTELESACNNEHLVGQQQKSTNERISRLEAPLAWYTCLQEWLQNAGFVTCKLDPCIFHRKDPEKVWIFVHVDNIAIFGKNLHIFKKEIDKEFEVKDIGPADLLLGMKISQLEEGMGMDQQHFVESLLEMYGMQDCKPVSTPIVLKKHLGPTSEEERITFDPLQINFRSAVGSINYLSTATWPDLSFAVSSLSQYLEKPGIQHWRAFLHVLKYFRGTQEIALWYPRKGEEGLITYSNTDWGNCCETRRSTSGFLA
ncbi:hypothetical protein O181_037251 [Austropuccinia psidii MF-1]|uniref:Reverse transcriptase Ty1/copia-type domain-containing protein n=1 Tax=Austropuccinia psidii MF-1 TaxID=1389203 RepID=A0A9Q3D5U0_9BASI|nr:hypothetical protein [Austropuccinia psidii MF-1]